MISLLRSSLILSVLLVSLSAAEKKPASQPAVPLETRVLEAAPGTEVRDPKAPQPGIPTDDTAVAVVHMNKRLRIAEAIPLPPTADGERRYDLMSYLKECGLEAGEGAEAIWLPDSGKLVLTMSVKDQDQAARMVETSPDFGDRSIASIQLAFSVWEYQDDPAKPQDPPMTGEELRQRPGLRLIHSQTVNTKSGNRVQSISRLAGPRINPVIKDGAPSTETVPSKPSLGNDRGAILEIEPVIGPDTISIDFNIEYEARLPSSVAGRDLELKGSTNLTVVSEQDIVIQSGYLDQGAEPITRRSYAVVVKGKFTYEQHDLREEHEARIRQKLREENKKVIQRAKEGLPVKAGAPSPRR